ncbi:GNA1162 family protein [Psychromonas sp. Urea-02u-13]|uniref:GNA1162 family protein n=1 Tax=Psychromonas sp. Urea-02u-13 TaxID=2058326 RepID=UPI000C324AFF|nr:GNA1162 family protein [Psychromonas sp. Urea-02u-13]PKG40376.1 hypothetical protein CXF74_03445 [Psychromonas sp. Urea-02u-13]
MRFFKLTLIFIIPFVLSACQTTKPIAKDMRFTEHSPTSILVLPVVNHSVDVQAPLAVYSSLPVLLAEKGYYVFPSYTVKTVLEYEGLYEPYQIQNLPTNQLADMFGADVVLYVTINTWDTTYLVLSSTTNINFSYEFRNKEGETIWKATKAMAYTPDSGSSGNALVDLISMLITSAINRAAPDYMPLTNAANQQVFHIDAATSLPNGPYALPLKK